MSKDMERYKVSELKNGRLAMLAFSGIVTQAALYDKGFPCKHRHYLHLIYAFFQHNACI
jgi:hypothetical protein